MKTCMHKALCMLLTFLSLALCQLSAQPFKRFKSEHFRHKYFRVGVAGGITSYVGDITSQKRPGVSVTGAYRFSPSSHVRLNLFYGHIAGTDSLSEERNERIRNLSFRSPIYEASLNYVFDIPFYGRRYDERPITAFYVWTGVGYHLFNPQANVNGQWVDLEPLGTEGQYLSDTLALAGTTFPTPYKRHGLVVPLGLGLRFSPKYQKWDIELELGWRATFTDYVDDVSGVYPDQNLLEGFNPLTAQLSDRIDRTSYSEADFPEGAPELIGSIRGDGRNIDLYMFSSISFNYILSNIGFKARR